MKKSDQILSNVHLIIDDVLGCFPQSEGSAIRADLVAIQDNLIAYEKAIKEEKTLV